MPRKYYNAKVAQAYRERNRERIRAYHKRYMEEYRLRPYVRKYYHRYYIKNGDRIRQRSCDISREKLYGVTSDQFTEMKRRQNNLCFVCGNPPSPNRSLSIDHCHATNTIRVLLCTGCNFLMGRIEKIGWKRLKKYMEMYLIK